MVAKAKVDEDGNVRRTYWATKEQNEKVEKVRQHYRWNLSTTVVELFEQEYKRLLKKGEITPVE